MFGEYSPENFHTESSSPKRDVLVEELSKDIQSLSAFGGQDTDMAAEKGV